MCIRDRKGHGSRLLKKVIEIAKREACKKIWCNARVKKISYYEKFGFSTTKRTFEKGGIRYVVMEKNFTKNRIINNPFQPNNHGTK